MELTDSKRRLATARAASKPAVTVIPSKELENRMERLAKFDPVLRHLVGMMVQRMRDAKFTAAYLYTISPSRLRSIVPASAE